MLRGTIDYLKYPIIKLPIIVALLATACSGPLAPSATGSVATESVATGSVATELALLPTPVPDESVPTEPNHIDAALYLQRASGKDLRFERISVEQGLSQSTVHCILQDSQGFMWFGTADGLNKYDGYHFTIYRHDPEDPHSLSDNHVWSLYEDTQGVLWVGTDGGLNRFEREQEQFVHYQHDSNDLGSLSYDTVGRIYEDSSGTLWIGTWGGGLNRFDREREQFTHYQHNPDDLNSLSHDFVGAIYEDPSRTLWVGTWGGLDRFDRQSGQFIHYRSNPSDPHSLSSRLVQSIYRDSTGTFWIGTAGGGLNKFDRASELFVHYQHDPDDPYSLSHDTVWEVYEDSSGVLWVVTDDGLNRFDPESRRFIRYKHNPADPHSLSNNMVYSIYEDRSGVLWIGTAGGGLNKVDQTKKRFIHYQHAADNPYSLSDNRVGSVFEDLAGMLWVGTTDGLNQLDQETGHWYHYYHDENDPHSLSNSSITAIHQDQAGTLWIGTYGGGLNKLALSDEPQARVEGLDQDSKRFTHYQHIPGDPFSLPDNYVTTVYQDQEGALWVGTEGYGIARFDAETESFTSYRPAPDDPRNWGNVIQVIYEGQAGELWIGTWNGLYRFVREQERFVGYFNDPDDPASLSDNIVYAIHQDRSGTLWVGTEGGLDRLALSAVGGSSQTTKGFIHYRVKDGLPNDVICGILEDGASGDLWISTNKGLSRFDPQTETFKNYDVRDGLQSNEFNKSSYYKNDRGEMFFGGINGLTVFYPGSIQDNPYVPPIVLTALTQGGEPIFADRAADSIREATLHWPHNYFEFEFVALSYIQPEENQYAYKLEGFQEEDWNYIGTRRLGRYTNLPGGTYTLRIKGSNNDGVWNEAGVAVRITVVPPFWATWWFRGIVALLVLGSALGGYRLRVRSIEARNRELQTQVEERTHALRQRTRELEERTIEIEQRRQELDALYRADERMHQHLHLDQVLQALVDVAVDILQADKSSVFAWDEDKKRWVMRVARGFSSKAMALISFAQREGITGYVIASGEPVIVEDSLTDPSRKNERPEILDIVDAEGVRSSMHLPIRIDDQVFGVFNLCFTQPRAFGEDEQRLFTALAQRAALAIENARLYEQTQEMAVIEERTRLARDLHDAVTQTLFSASLIAEALPNIWESDQEEGRELLAEMRRLSRGALAEMRTLLLELRPAALVEANLGDLLHQLVEAVTGREDVSVTVDIQGQCELPSDVHVALYRIAQEAMNNVVKHAYADHVEVRLRCSELPEKGEMAVELCISDNGCGFDADGVLPDHLGLNIMRERAQAAGASLDIDSKVGTGTRVSVVWKGGKR